MVALMAIMDGDRLCPEGASNTSHCTHRPSMEDVRALGELGLSLVVVDRSLLGVNSGAGGQVAARTRALHELSELLGTGVPIGTDTVVYQPWGAVFECENRGDTDGVR